MTKHASSLLHFFPSVLIEDDFEMNLLKDAIAEYKDDIRSTDLVELEIKI